MRCPYCGEEMKLGYIQCRDGVAWSKKKRLVAAISSLGADLVLADEEGMFSGAAVPAYNCESCKKILIDYSNNK